MRAHTQTNARTTAKRCICFHPAQVFNNCVRDGVNLFDTAEVYGLGRSEYLCGKFRRDYKGLDKEGIVIGAVFDFKILL